ncbi:phenylalanine--tRNA ligase beta subunit [mine drainage metagenome]|uniref:Phenylalanine--tRNA ligase beta subunit n=1 Tax=mine drainage metagenome TaxID=410659 RepID=A0A1J5RYR5_9ZZZZ
MKLSLNWLKDYVRLDASVDEIARAITFLGLEVEGVVQTGAPKLDQVVVGEVLTRDKHPNADKLSVCTVDVGLAGGVKTIVCGAQNYKVGDRVPVALPGAVLPGNFVIKQSKIRGQSSDGMMCSAKELGAAEDASGLMILAGRPALGTPINDVLPAGDTVIDIEVTPNRPDCLCHLGVARELAAWFKKDLVYPEIKFSGVVDENVLGANRHDLLTGVRVEAPDDCPLYSAHIVAGVKIGPSPEWMQSRLLAAGLRPINNIVDVTNFVLLEYGQPLHAFDAKKLAGRQIVVRRANDGEKLVTLDGKERSLSSRMLVIADAERPVVVAGVMGGENSGVDETTTDIVLEAALFKRQSVRWTSKTLGLSSDSSYRFERGVDSHSTLEAARRAVDLIVATAGGRVVSPVFKVGGDKPWKREIAVTTPYIRERLGFSIPDDEMRQSLEALELRIVREEPAQGGGLAWTVSVPSWRDDLDRPIDLVEEVLRLYGTDRIPQAVVKSPGLIGEDDPVVTYNRRVNAYLVGHDFHECVNLTLRPEKELATWASQAAAEGLRLSNPFVEDQSNLRGSLVPGLLESLRLNQSRGVAVSRLFETGRVFLDRNGQLLECVAVAFVIAETEERPWKRREPADFYGAKHHAEALAKAAGVDISRLVHGSSATPGLGWQSNQAACAGEIGHGWLAQFGLVDLALTKAAGVAGRVIGGQFVILPEKLGGETARRRFVPFSLYPAALRDIALVVESGVPAEEVRKALTKVARAAVGTTFTLEGVEVFDVYQGAGLPEGRKSLAFSLTFRSPERTLTDDEVNGVFNRIQDEIVKAGYVVRK